jgi:hypothetical protein
MHYAMVYGGTEISALASVSGQLHVQAALPPEREPPVFIG